MCTVFILVLLAWDSSGQPHDSVQYCISDRASWRVQTRPDGGGSVEISAVAVSAAAVEATAEADTRSTFGAAIQRKLTIIGADDAASLQAALQRHGLRGRVVTDDARRFAYWQAPRPPGARDAHPTPAQADRP